MVHAVRLVGLLQRSSSAFLGNCRDAYAAQPAIYITARGLATRKLFVGGMSNRTKVEDLRSAFAAHGEIIQARLSIHPTSKVSRGFGFIEYSSAEEAEAAINKMNGQVLGGRKIRVTYAVTEAKTGEGEGES